MPTNDTVVPVVTLALEGEIANADRPKVITLIEYGAKLPLNVDEPAGNELEVMSLQAVPNVPLAGFDASSFDLP